MHYHYLPQELIDLQTEIAEHHPNITLILQTLVDQDIYLQIAAIAVECNMILHGDYTQKDMLDICKKLTEKLVKKRTIHITGELDLTVVQNLPDASNPGSLH